MIDISFSLCLVGRMGGSKERNGEYEKFNSWFGRREMPHTIALEIITFWEKKDSQAAG